MKAISPEEFVNKQTKVNDLVDYFNKLLKKQEKNKSWYGVEINQTYEQDILDGVEKAFKDAGWKKVSCYISRDIMEEERTILSLNP
jgi:methylase of polypeptide subunit release factors